MPTVDKPLGTFLKARRERIDPARYGLDKSRRRTPGLRREEVAQRASISAKWYTFLEQGRGGPPSLDVVDRLSRALDLTEAERDHLLHLVQPQRKVADASPHVRVPPALRRLLDVMEHIPAFVKTATWDIVAWNRAAATVLTDYGSLPADERNLLRLLFSGPEVRNGMADWESHARFAVAAFRSETTRVGMAEAAATLVAELRGSSAAFNAMWADNEVGVYGAGLKEIVHPVTGTMQFEYSTLAVDGRSDLGLVVFTPATERDAARVRSLVQGMDNLSSTAAG